jgi:hypothetical protein
MLCYLGGCFCAAGGLLGDRIKYIYIGRKHYWNTNFYIYKRMYTISMVETDSIYIWSVRYILHGRMLLEGMEEYTTVGTTLKKMVHQKAQSIPDCHLACN